MYVRPLSSQREEDPDDLVESEAIRMQDDERRSCRDFADALVDVFGTDDAHSDGTQGTDDDVSNGIIGGHDQGPEPATNG